MLHASERGDVVWVASLLHSGAYIDTNVNIVYVEFFVILFNFS